MGEGGLRKAFRRLTSDATELAAEDLQEQVRDAGCTSIADAPNRVLVSLLGEIRSVTLRPRAGVPALEADVDDGTGSVIVVWLGRRQIAGITPGAKLRVEGRIGESGGRRTIFNPIYQLLPRSH
jgi:hypothetical protein